MKSEKYQFLYQVSNIYELTLLNIDDNSFAVLLAHFTLPVMEKAIPRLVSNLSCHLALSPRARSLVSAHTHSFVLMCVENN